MIGSGSARPLIGAIWKDLRLEYQNPGRFKGYQSFWRNTDCDGIDRAVFCLKLPKITAMGGGLYGSPK